MQNYIMEVKTMNNLIGKCFKYKSLLPNLLNGTYEIIDIKADKVIARKLQQFVAEDFAPKEFDLEDVKTYLLETKEIEVNAKELSQIIDGLEHINHNKKINFDFSGFYVCFIILYNCFFSAENNSFFY